MQSSLFRLVLPQIHPAVFLTSAGALLTLSHAIEDVLLNYVPMADLAVGFQRFSRLVPQLPRYRRLAAACRQVWVFGFPDATVEPTPGLSTVELSADSPMVHEWFLVVNTPGLSVAMIAEESTPGALGAARQFQASLTFDPELVDETCRSLSASLPRPLMLTAGRDVTSQQKHMSLIVQRLIGYQEQRAARLQRDLAGVRASYSTIAEQTRMLRELIELLPHFDSVPAWRQLLLENIRQVAAAGTPAAPAPVRNAGADQALYAELAQALEH